MNSIISIALSGLNAAQKRLEVSAANVANAGTTGPLPDATSSAAATAQPAYTPLQVDQQTLSGGAVSVKISAVAPATSTAYAPNASFADQAGLVAAPNVDLANEAVNQIQAAQAYRASAQLISVAGNLEKQLLDSFDPGSTHQSA
jgi:flagellar basal-body rod protein FlgC